MKFDPLVQQKLEDLLNGFRDRVDYLEFRLERKQRDTIHYNEKGVKNLSYSEGFQGCVRAAYQGGWGFFSFSDLENLESRTTEAIDMARLLGQGKTSLAPVQAIQDEVLLSLTRDPRQTSLQDKLALLESYRDRLMNYPSDRIRACRVSYTEELMDKLFINSEGSNIFQEFMAMDLTLSAIAFHDGVQTPMIKILNHTHDFNYFLNQEKECEEVASQAVEFSDARSMEGGEFTVILDPIMAGTLAHESFGHTSEADLFASSPGGRETLRIGRQFGKEVLNIYDTGDMKDYSGSLTYDDEGVPTRHTDLIKQGVLAGRLHTRLTAADFGEEVTGNARAVSAQFPPICRMRNTCIAPGPDSLQDLIADTRDGVYALGLYGGHGGENFSFFPARGYRIREGKLCEPVKNFSLSGNLFETLDQIDGVTGKEDFSTLAASGENGGCGKGEQFPLPVGMSAPHVRIQKIQIGGGA